MKRGRIRRKTDLSAKRAGGFKVRKPVPPDGVDAGLWAGIRAEVADRWWCEANTPECPPGRHRGAHAHHVLMRSQGGPDEAANLLWVCPPAHRYIHANPAESYERGWLRRGHEVGP